MLMYFVDPRQSPDFNATCISRENLSQRTISNEKELKNTKMEEWPKISPYLAKNLVEYMCKKCKGV